MGKERDGFRSEDGGSAAQHGISEYRDIGSSRKQARMARDSPHHAGVLVLHFALENSFSEGLIVSRRSNVGTPGPRRIESGVQHSKRSEDLVRAELVDCFLGQSFQNRTQDYEADIAVLGMTAGFIF